MFLWTTYVVCTRRLQSTFPCGIWRLEFHAALNFDLSIDSVRHFFDICHMDMAQWLQNLEFNGQFSMLKLDLFKRFCFENIWLGKQLLFTAILGYTLIFEALFYKNVHLICQHICQKS